MLYALSKTELTGWLEKLAQKYQLFVPISPDGFGPYQGQEPYLEGKTKLSAKEFFLPAREEMLRFQAVPSALPEKITPLTQEVVVFGVRPCDAKGVSLIEKVFERDEFFKARRERTYLIGYLCAHPGRDCFCGAMGVDPFSGQGLEILMVEDDGRFLVKTFSEKGKDLVALSSAKEATKEEEILFDQKKETFLRQFKPAPVLEKLKEKDLLAIYKAPFWEEIAFACINCGTCTFLCPTCYCFDVQDEVVGQEGVRVRLWDACMFSLYSQHASGHNPRCHPAARFRNRFMHKFKYFLDLYGEPLCVGCGRCLEECPANINLWEVITKMAED